MVDRLDYVELGLICSDACIILDRGVNKRGPDELGQPVCDAIAQLTM